jgi:diguanylate cyclase (GGDEF)-like protein
MPEKSGFDMFNDLIEINKELPIVFLTGASTPHIRNQALRLGATNILKKPVDIDELLAQIKGALKKTKSRNASFHVDDLTGAYTRKYFSQQFEQETTRYIREGTIFSVAFLDLDYFKAINDTYGHLFGDKMLTEFTHTLQDYLNEKGDIYRFGGDEFLVIFRNVKAEEAKEIIEEIRADIQSKPFITAQNDQVILSFSAGIAEFNDKSETKTTLLQKADKALYMAKENGKNQTVVRESNASIIKDKILVVDDEPLLRRIIETRLGYLGYTIDHASDGQEAIDKIAESRYDLILLDIMLPKVTGIEVLKQIKNRRFNDDQKVIILSGNHNESIKLEALQLGADDFLEKPFSLSVLEHKIKKIMTT